MNVNSAVSGTIGTALSGSLGAIGPITLAGIPSTYHIAVDSLPTIVIDEIKMHSKIDPVDVTAHVAIEKIPDIRAHLPANFSVGLSVLGFELLCVRLCGEAQMITEPYRPNPCEVCGHSRELSHPEYGLVESFGPKA
jgi:hypothetical protein